eukprot:COSAG02_NODE_2040_length_10033_cov_3.206362_3_plen_100_part_00
MAFCVGYFRWNWCVFTPRSVGCVAGSSVTQQPSAVTITAVTKIKRRCICFRVFVQSLHWMMDRFRLDNAKWYHSVIDAGFSREDCETEGSAPRKSVHFQ